MSNFSVHFNIILKIRTDNHIFLLSYIVMDDMSSII
jgi:hypothetical protein